MKNIIIATHNIGKIKEYRDIFSRFAVNVIGLADLDIDLEIIEIGKTFEENAILKAEAVSQKIQQIVIADDTGLMVHALGDIPGLYSARFMGTDTPQVIKNQALIDGLVNKSDRSASFTCAIALAIPGKKTQVVKGVINGFIAEEIAGSKGFGYDPIFIAPQYNQTFAQLGSRIKDTISHRYLATMQLIELMKKEALI